MAEGKQTSQIAHPSQISLKAVDTYRPRHAQTVELLEPENNVFSHLFSFLEDDLINKEEFSYQNVPDHRQARMRKGKSSGAW